MADTDVFGETGAEKMSTEDLSEEPSKEIKEELLKEETEELNPDSSVKEVVDENGDVYEETTQVARKVVKRTMKITETSSTTKTTTMTTPAKLYGKDLSEYDEVDVDALLAQLSPEEINILAKEVDPDDNFLPPNQRCSYECTKDPTGPLDRKKLIEHINKEALETPDLPEIEPFVKGTIRGKKWVPPPRDDRELQAEEQIAIDMGEEYEHALSDATQEEIIDLAAILGFHSMMNQDQYHASLLNKGQPIGMGWDGITKSTAQKLYPMDPPNTTDVDESIKRVKEDDSKLIELNLNNIKNISDEKYEQLFAALPQNEHLEVLSLTNVGLTDKTALLLAEAIEKSKTLRVLNVETNFISPPVIVTLVKALLKARTIEEFRASNQRSTVLGNKIEMEITDLVEKNTSLLRLGLHLEFNDARHRVAAHLQRNIDRNEHEMRKGNSLSPIPKSTSPINRNNDLLSMQKAKSPKPVHLILTPQERIDSKSELIASLESQKQSNRDKGEISLTVPQKTANSVSPVKEVTTNQPTNNTNLDNNPAKVENNVPAKSIVDEKSVPKEAKFPTKKRISPVKVKSPVKDEVSPIKEFKVPPPHPSLEESPSVTEEKKISPSRNPKLAELRHSNVSRALEIDSDDQLNIESISKEEKGTRNENEGSGNDSPKQLELNKHDEEPSVNNQDLIDRESVSPSRQLEDKMTLLQAKIDSFAEVADEKIASLRSKIEDIARGPSPDITNKPPERQKPIVSLSTAEAITLLPKPPVKNVHLPSLPLMKTPNSVGITLIYQHQIFEKPSVGIVDKEAETVTSLKNVTENSKEVPISQPTPTVEKSFIQEKKVKNVSPSKTTTEIPDKSESKEERKIQEKTPEIDSQKETISPALNPTTNIAIEKERESQEIKSEVKIEETPKIDRRALTLSLLKIKKGDAHSIDPVQATEVQTQSSPKPSPLLRFSVKKVDQQKIDPIKMSEASTQSLPKRNPMSYLTIKKGETITINPIKKSEMSTQFAFEKPQAEASSQTIEEDPIQTLEDATQTPLVFSSLEHDYIFPGLRRVPYLPRPKSINIGSGDRVIVKPASKPINEVLMLLYPVIHDYSKPKESKTFGLEEDIVKYNETDNTIKDLEETMKKATDLSEQILNAPPNPSEEVEKVEEEEANTSVRTEIEIPLAEETRAPVASEARFETKFTAVEKVSAISRTTIESQEHVEFIDKAYNSVAEVSTSEREKASTTTSIKSANMWQSLSSNLIRASEQTLLDLSKSTERGDGLSSNRTKIGKVSVYSSIEDLSRSKISDRHLGALIKTVETTSVYSSLEDIPYTKYSDRYKDGKGVVSTSVYSSSEDLLEPSNSKYTLDLDKSVGKQSIYDSTEDLSYSKPSDHYKVSHYTVDLPRSVEAPREKLSLLPRSKFSDRYKSDLQLSSQPKFPVSHELPQIAVKIDRSYFKSAMSADHSASRSHYKSSEELVQRTKISEHSAQETYKSHGASLQTSIQSAISRNTSALRPYTYVPTLVAHTDVSIDHVRNRPASLSTHTSTLQLKISPSGISELPSTLRTSKYNRDKNDKPIIKISRARDDARSFRTISPTEKRTRPSKNLLSPYQVSDPTNNDKSMIDESSQSMLETTSIPDNDDISSTPKKRLNIMETIKMLKNRVRDVITTEDRFTESHRLSSSSSNTSSFSITRRGSRSGVRSKDPYDRDEKEI